MNELLLIDMLCELNPKLLQNSYIEKDMNREKIPFLNRLFSFKKPANQESELSFEEDFSKIQNLETNNKNEEFAKMEIFDKLEFLEETNQNNLGFTISIFKKNFNNLIKIISGLAAAFLVVIGIVIFIIRHHKSGIKLFEKKIQIIF